MSIDSFLTTPVSQTLQNAASAKTGPTQEKPLNGLTFFDLFLANLEQTLEHKKVGYIKETAEPVDPNATPQEKVETLLLDVLANSEYSRKELAKLDDPALVDMLASSDVLVSSDVLALNKVVDDKQLLQIKLPENKDISSILESLAISTEADFRPALNNLQRVLQKISTMLEKQDPNLINTNLDPQQITELQTKVGALIQGEDVNVEEFAGVFAGLINILPPQTKHDIIVTGKNIIIANGAVSSSQGQAAAANDSNSQMNNLLQKNKGLNQGLEWTANSVDASEGEDSVEALIKNMGKSFKAVLDSAGNINTKPENSAALAQVKTLPDLSLVQNLQTSGFPLLADLELSPAMMDELGLSLNALTPGASQAGLTSLVTQSAHAGAPHPGTQMVAATLQRAGSSGNPNNILLQLEPPELGRVEVRMSFEPNSTIKAVMTVEKPETLMMLQRDQHILERALQDAGLDSEGGLSFELASEEHAFSQDGSHDGSRSGSGSQQNDELSEEPLIETTMTWMVDPETGHMHYNVYA